MQCASDMPHWQQKEVLLTASETSPCLPFPGQFAGLPCGTSPAPSSAAAASMQRCALGAAQRSPASQDGLWPAFVFCMLTGTDHKSLLSGLIVVPCSDAAECHSKSKTCCSSHQGALIKRAFCLVDAVSYPIYHNSPKPAVIIPHHLRFCTIKKAHDPGLGWQVEGPHFWMPSVVRLHQAILRVLNAWHLWPSLVWGFALLNG